MAWYNMNQKKVNEVRFRLAGLEFRQAVNKFSNPARPSYRYIRDIVVQENNQNVVYAFSFAATANNQLKAAIENCQALRINPLEVEFCLRKTGEGINTVYSLIVGERIGIAQNVVQSGASVQGVVNAPDGFQLPSSSTLTLTVQEQDILNEAKQYPYKLTEEQFIDGFRYSYGKKYMQYHGDLNRLKGIYKMY